MDKPESSPKRQKTTRHGVASPDSIAALSIVLAHTKNPWLQFKLLQVSFCHFAPVLNRNRVLTPGDKLCIDQWLKQPPNFWKRTFDKEGNLTNNLIPHDAAFLLEIQQLVCPESIDLSETLESCIMHDAIHCFRLLLVDKDSFLLNFPRTIGLCNKFPEKCISFLQTFISKHALTNLQYLLRNLQYLFLRQFKNAIQNSLPIDHNLLSLWRQTCSPISPWDLIEMVASITIAEEYSPLQLTWFKELIASEAWPPLAVNLTEKMVQDFRPWLICRFMSICEFCGADPQLLLQNLRNDTRTRHLISFGIDGIAVPVLLTMSELVNLEDNVISLSWPQIFQYFLPDNQLSLIGLFLARRPLPHSPTVRSQVLALLEANNTAINLLHSLSERTNIFLSKACVLHFFQSLSGLGYDLDRFDVAENRQFFCQHSGIALVWIKTKFAACSSVEGKSAAQKWWIDFCLQFPPASRSSKRLRVALAARVDKSTNAFWKSRKNHARRVGHLYVWPFSGLELSI